MLNESRSRLWPALLHSFYGLNKPTTSAVTLQKLASRNPNKPRAPSRSFQHSEFLWSGLSNL